jgi:hypothetical protein
VSSVAISVSFGKNIVRQKTLKEVNMVKDCVRSFLLVILLAAIPITGSAQDAKTVLGKALQALGTESAKTLQYSGSGSTYDEKGQHSSLSSYTRQIELGKPPASDSPWSDQLEYWLSPYGFVKGAAATSATVESKPFFGETFTVVTVNLPGNHQVVGYINKENLVERIQTTDNGVAIEAVYHDYEKMGGFEVPTVQIRNRAGALAQVVIIKDAKILAI